MHAPEGGLRQALAGVFVYDKQKSSPGKSDELLNIFCVLLKAWDLTYLSLALTKAGVGTLQKNLAGCQGFIGPFPSAFLDKHVPVLPGMPRTLPGYKELLQR